MIEGGWLGHRLGNRREEPLSNELHDHEASCHTVAAREMIYDFFGEDCTAILPAELQCKFAAIAISYPSSLAQHGSNSSKSKGSDSRDSDSDSVLLFFLFFFSFFVSFSSVVEV